MSYNICRYNSMGNINGYKFGLVNCELRIAKVTRPCTCGNIVLHDVSAIRARPVAVSGVPRKNSPFVMPIDTREICDALQVLAQQQNMRASVKSCTKAALISGAGGFFGGLLGGAMGIVIGSTLGGLTAAWKTGPECRPVWEIIRNDFTDEQRRQIVLRVQRAVQNLQLADLVPLLALLANDLPVQQVAKQAMLLFFRDMGMQILD